MKPFILALAAGVLAASGYWAPLANAAAPNILVQPRSRTNVVGSSLMLSVTANGVEPLAYQWFKDGVALAGAAGRTHVLANVQSTNAGTYRVTVSDFGGMTLSSDAQLAIQPAEKPMVIGGPLIDPANGHEYFLLAQSTWVEAETRAQAMGGHLATLRSADEQEWVFTNFGAWGGQERNLWIGLHDADPVNNATNSDDRPAEFVWASGEPVTYENWTTGEPNNYRELGEYYVHMLSPSDLTGAGKWNDTWDTDVNQGPFCGVVEVQFTNAVVAVIAGPITNAMNGHVYYLLEQSTWLEAEMRSRAFGGHLATLRNAAEQEWLFTNFSTWGGQERNLWIGLHDADPLNNATNTVERQAEFVWASGEPVTYANWTTGEPNNYRELGEYYVHMLSPDRLTEAGRWNDTWDTNFNQQPIYGVMEVENREVIGYPITLLTDARSLEINGSGHYCISGGVCPSTNYHDAALPSIGFGVFDSHLMDEEHLGGGFGNSGFSVSSEATQVSSLSQGHFEAAGFASSTASVGWSGDLDVPLPGASAFAGSLFDIVFSVPETLFYRITGEMQAQSSGRSSFALLRVEGPDVVRLSLSPGDGLHQEVFMDVSGSLLPGTYRLTASATGPSGANRSESSDGSARFSISADFINVGTSTSQIPSRVWGNLSWPLHERSLTIQHPASRTNVVGSSLMLSVGAEGNEPLTYQWFKNGAVLPGATGPTHLLLNVQSTDSGVYHVTVSNFIGLASSDTLLTIVPAQMPPVVAGPLINPANGNEYYLLEQSTWVEAEARAQTMGGHLATLRNAAEQEWVFANFSAWGGTERNLWIGLYDADPANNSTNSVDRRAEFGWASGEPASYANWSAGPNGNLELGEFYVRMLSPSNPTGAGKWNDTWDTDFNQKPLQGVAEVVRRRRATLGRTENGQFELNVSGFPGDVYRIEASTNLVHWNFIGTVTNLNGTTQFKDTDPTSFNRRFYRLLLP